ncbi:MAG: hypothetical protein AAF471_05020 [Myxococcota bacterium]
MTRAPDLPDDPEMAGVFETLHPHLRRLGEGVDGKDCQRFVEAAFLYALFAGNTGLWKDVIMPIAEDCMKPDRVEVLMTTAERLKFEGMQQGKLQGLEEVAVRLIKVGMDTADIAKATSLPQQRVQELRVPTNGMAKK